MNPPIRGPRRSRGRVLAGLGTGVTLLVALCLVPPAAGTTARAPAEHQETWNWVVGQLATGTVVTSPSVIAPAENYPASWTGPVQGTFELHDVAVPAPYDPSPVTLETPLELPETYAGPVTGSISVPAQQSRWIIDVVRRSSAGDVPAGVQALVSADGSFGLDLRTAWQGAGAWGLRLLDAHAGYAQVGETWPAQQLYPGVEVRAYVVTDTAYLVGSAPARADGTFAMPASQPGVKIFRLVDLTSGDVLAEAAPETGLVRSFGLPAEHQLHGRTFVYDQALALLTAQSLGEHATARRLAAGLVRLQTDGGIHDGGFITGAAALNPEAGLPEYRSGNHAIATYALLRHLAGLEPGDPWRHQVHDASVRAVAWLLDRQVAAGPLAGLVTGGYGAMVNGSFDPDVELEWASTEHNLDAWHTLRLAEAVLGDTGAGQAAATLTETIPALLWDTAGSRFYQGRTPTGPDATEALDVNSWGSIFLQATGRADLAQAALHHTGVFTAAVPPLAGYAPHLHDGLPLIWTEGSAGVALAQVRLGHADQASATLADLATAALSDGSWRAANRDDAALSMTTAPAVAAATWVVLAHQSLAGRPSLWDEP